MFAPRPVVFLAATALIGFAVRIVLIVVNAWTHYQNGTLLEFRNASNERLCYWGPPDPNCTEIKPNGTSYGNWNSCTGGVPVTIATPDRRKIYSRFIDCADLDDVFFLINKRDGEFLVLDNVDSKSEFDY
jgi:hypothetical protein